MQETGVQSLGQEDPLEKEMVDNFSVLAWKIPWGHKRVRHDGSDLAAAANIPDGKSHG